MRFERDRWYSSENRRAIGKRAHQESSGTRRVISLAFLLAMILVVMRQMTDPAKYEPAFRAIGLVPAGKSNAIRDPDVPTKKDESARNLSAEGTEKETSLSDLIGMALATSDLQVDQFAQMWDALLKLAPPEVINSLAERLSVENQKTGDSSEASSDSSNTVEVSEATRNWLIESNARVRQWLVEASSHESEKDASMDLFLSQWNAWSALTDGGVLAVDAALSDEIRQGLRLALDRRLLKIIQDASPWRSVERPAMLRTLQRAIAVSRYCNREDEVTKMRIASELRTLPKVEVPRLTKQSQDLRGRLVRMRGRPISNTIATESSSQLWGEFAYDVVWIYPDDNSQQPVCLYAVRSAKGETGSASERGSDSSPPGGWPVIKPDQVGKVNANMSSVEVTGFFLKRLAFASKRGVDVAPVLVVCNSRWVDEEKPDSERRSLSLDQGIDKSDIDNRDLREDSKLSSVIKLLSATSAPLQQWREPGLHRNQLELLKQVVEEPIVSLSLETLQACVSNEFSTTMFAEDPKRIEAIVRVLYPLPRVRIALKGAIESDGKIGTSRITKLAGIVTQCISIPLPGPQAEAIGQKAIYRLKVQLAPSTEVDPSTTLYAIVNRVPEYWLAERHSAETSSGDSSMKVLQPVVLEGLLMDALLDSSGMIDEGVLEKPSAARLMLSDTPRWTWGEEGDFRSSPTETSTQLLPAIPSGWDVLASVGWDLSAIRFVKSQRGKPISAEESEAFYSLMSAADQIASLAKPDAVETITAMECLQGGAKSILGRVATKIRIVRVTRIDVPEEANRIDLKGSAYYELDGLADIGEQVIQLKSPDGTGDIRFQGRFPMTLVTKSVPDWLLSNSANSNDSTNPDLSQGIWYPSTNVNVEGVFYRLWSYSTGQTANVSEKAGSAGLRQIGPLVAVTKWEQISQVPTVTKPSRSLVREVLTALAIASGAIWFFYRYQSSKK